MARKYAAFQPPIFQDVDSIDESLADYKKRIFDNLISEEEKFMGYPEFTPNSYQEFFNRVRCYLSSFDFILKISHSKSIRELRNYLAIQIEANIEILKIYDGLIKKTCELKNDFLKSYASSDENSESFDYLVERDKVDNALSEYLNSILPDYSFELRLIRNLNDILSKEDSKIWCVALFKKHLSINAQKFNIEEILNELLAHPFFNDSVYASLDLEYFKLLINNRFQTLKTIINSIDSLKMLVSTLGHDFFAEMDKTYGVFRNYGREDVIQLCAWYEDDFSLRKTWLEENNSMFILGKKLIEDDFQDIPLEDDFS